jgi:membrane associated rhomboid family serine protease
VTVPPGPQPYEQQAMPVCVRHPDRPTGLRCVRCDRPACPQCLREASVGYQCVDCVNEGRRAVRQHTTVAGATLRTQLLVVPVMVVLNLVVFAFTAAQAGNLMDNDRSRLFDDWVLWPFAVVAYDEPWRLVTSGFLHYGPIHIALNMVALWILGREIEPLLGRARFLAVYLLSLLGGSAAVFLFGSIDAGTAGASGAVWGIMGAMLVAVLRLKLNVQPVLGVIAINVFISFLPGISLLGHLGGFAAGAAATAALVYAPAQGRNRFQVIGLSAVAVVVVAAIVVRWAQLA